MTIPADPVAAPEAIRSRVRAAVETAWETAVATGSLAPRMVNVWQVSAGVSYAIGSTQSDGRAERFQARGNLAGSSQGRRPPMRWALNSLPDHHLAHLRRIASHRPCTQMRHLVFPPMRSVNALRGTVDISRRRSAA